MNFSDVLALAAVAIAAVVLVGLVVRSKLRRIDRATGRMHAALTSHGYPEHRADLPAKVCIYPPADRGRVTR